MGYSFVPAAGPCHAMADQFTVPLHGWWITRLNDRLVSFGSNGVDVFPSLHCAVSAFFLFFHRQHRPWRFWLYLVPCVGLWVSTIYLRYHYAIDLVCGFALAGFALWLSKHFPSDDFAQNGSLHKEARNAGMEQPDVNSTNVLKQSGRGPSCRARPHSKTLRAFREISGSPRGLGVRLPSAALPCL